MHSFLNFLLAVFKLKYIDKKLKYLRIAQIAVLIKAIA
jgi:hypothetical protein